MTNPLFDVLSGARNAATTTPYPSQDVAARRPDELARVLRRANDVKAQATDRASTTEARGVSPRAAELSRSASVTQVVEQGLGAVSASLRQISVVLESARAPTVGQDEIAALQRQLDTLRMDVFRMTRHTSAALQQGAVFRDGGGAARDQTGPDAGSELDSEELAATLRSINLRDAGALGGIRQNVEATLKMVSSARSEYARLNEHLATQLEDEADAGRPVLVWGTSLAGLHLESAAVAVEAAQHVRALLWREGPSALEAQANASPADVLRALSE